MNTTAKATTLPVRPRPPRRVAVAGVGASLRQPSARKGDNGVLYHATDVRSKTGVVGVKLKRQIMRLKRGVVIRWHFLVALGPGRSRRGRIDRYGSRAAAFRRAVEIREAFVAQATASRRPEASVDQRRAKARAKHHRRAANNPGYRAAAVVRANAWRAANRERVNANRRASRARQRSREEAGR